MRVGLTNHVSMQFDVPADRIWQDIYENYVEAKSFKDAAYVIEPLNDPAAFRGGYRMTLSQDGAIVDEREVYLLEIDEGNRRLSAFVRYFSPSASGLEVTACYQAVPEEQGCRYLLDCWTWISLDASEVDVATQVLQLEQEYDEALVLRMAALKEKLEA